MAFKKIEIMPTGVPGLDTLFGGGVPVGSLLMIVGSPGTGKTTLMQQICFAWARRESNSSDRHPGQNSDQITPDYTSSNGNLIILPDPASSSKRKLPRNNSPKALYFSTLSESHDKLITHLSQFDFFDEVLLNNYVKLLSLTTSLDEGLEQIASLIVDNARRQKAALVAVDGFYSLKNLAKTPTELRQFLYRISSQLGLLGVTTLLSLETNIETLSPEGDLTIADGVLNLSNEFQGAREFRRIEVRKMRGNPRLLGRHAYDISENGVVVYPRLETLVKPELTYTVGRNERLGFGLPELETMLGGGLPRNSSTIVAGSPGTGKTLLGLKYLIEGWQKGENGLLVTFSESYQQLLDKANDFGMDLAAPIAAGQITLLTLSSVELELDKLVARIRQLVENNQVHRFVLDDLLPVERSASFESRSYEFIAALVGYLKERQVTALYNLELSKLVGTELDFSNSPFLILAENVLLLRYVEYRSKLYRIVSVLKMRDSGFDPTIREFVINTKDSLKVLEPFQSVEGVLTGLARTLERSQQE
jgi:circadian clock protein KaiC